MNGPRTSSFLIYFYSPIISISLGKGHPVSCTVDGNGSIIIRGRKPSHIIPYLSPSSSATILVNSHASPIRKDLVIVWSRGHKSISRFVHFNSKAKSSIVLFSIDLPYIIPSIAIGIVIVNNYGTRVRRIGAVIICRTSNSDSFSLIIK